MINNSIYNKYIILINVSYPYDKYYFIKDNPQTTHQGAQTQILLTIYTNL